jgi:hypothetical protein
VCERERACEYVSESLCVCEREREKVCVCERETETETERACVKAINAKNQQVSVLAGQRGVCSLSRLPPWRPGSVSALARNAVDK